jgi:diguanylate cyclase (GGDEF)-like protein
VIFAFANSIFSDNIKLLRTEASKTAYQGVGIAFTTIFIATALVCYLATGHITFEGMVTAQKTNVALWILDAMPFFFGIWGQYSNTLMAYHAGALILDQTQELRDKADNLEKETAYVSTHDKLTDLPNRALFYDRVEQIIISTLSAGASQRRLAILLIEIENFKDVYDTLGRNSSDLILKQIATRIQGVCLERDMVAKIDGNIFGVLLSDHPSSKDRSENFALQIQDSLEEPFNADKLQVAVHSNVGIVYFPDHGEDVDTLVQRAGVALHIAQQSNKGLAVYESTSDNHTPYRLALMPELRYAIERDVLDLFYQPKIAIKTGEICGAEALLRWNHPEHGYVPPDEFIPMAERNRMIKQLTLWMLRRAFRDCAAWHKQGLPLNISVNLSVKDLHDPELPDLISGVAIATGIKPSWITFEITEGSVMAEPEHALVIIKKLHDKGYRFSIDDFGTGYSSLSYLKKLPLTELKIDKSFVMDILTSDNDVAIVKTTINLAHNLGLKVTAEGVESKEIMAKLNEYECDIAQGFFLSKPISVKNFTQWVADSKWEISKNCR